MVCVGSRSISPYSVGTPDAIGPSTHAVDVDVPDRQS